MYDAPLLFCLQVHRLVVCSALFKGLLCNIDLSRVAVSRDIRAGLESTSFSSPLTKKGCPYSSSVTNYHTFVRDEAGEREGVMIVSVRLAIGCRLEKEIFISAGTYLYKQYSTDESICLNCWCRSTHHIVLRRMRPIVRDGRRVA